MSSLDEQNNDNKRFLDKLREEHGEEYVEELLRQAERMWAVTCPTRPRSNE
jgi:hypothetical protein